MTHRSSRVLTAIGIVALALTATTACTTGADSPEPSASVSEPTTSASPNPSRQPDSGQRATTGAAESFSAWLAASRVPEVDTACAGLAPQLVQRMIAELNANAGVSVSTCEEMIAASAQLYKAAGQDASVDIAVQHETAADATLFVTYGASGDCGTVVMHRAGTAWIITEQSEECAR
ncbi:hypothetical protein [Leifsonia sp. 1010]|uniref:hypothetical protein n=1 Tax=Leifsonia sp. 1010 TaxID=2817769 RepID=UPI002861D40C|nr:hypothetical protein [Leifsonia sp. 1010]MDR6611220.1 hypothetical protein [Leifsonia sp. 1010]